VLIDRDGQHFNLILDYLRDGTLTLPESTQMLNELLHEAKFFCIESLIELIEHQLRTRSKQTRAETEAACKIIMLTSAKELPHLVASVRKPIVKLAINRHNNKYSYTASVRLFSSMNNKEYCSRNCSASSSSDEMLMKNMELFDKLSIRLHDRIVFIKDVTSSEEICCWTFYGHGQKVAEVCCTSIVYATERKQNKVNRNDLAHCDRAY
jgi:BTB/POZ domain-containing adapter for CUL3-mediated RhoA degradation protein